MSRTLIVGLGNPGPTYEKTRHNIGFMAIDRLAARHQIDLSAKKFKGVLGSGLIADASVILLKPQTFMNLSGQSVQPALAFYGLGVEQLIVVHDELDLPVGVLRLKQGGGHGGHNGLKDIINRCASKDFIRVRLGIGRPERGEVTDHVLGPFRKVDEPLRDELIELACDALEVLLAQDLLTAQNRFHPKEPDKKDAAKRDADKKDADKKDADKNASKQPLAQPAPAGQGQGQGSSKTSEPS